MATQERIYDLIIIGAGPAGMSAGIYAGRAMLDVLILEKGRVGGQVTTTEEIVNYPGFKKTTGAELMQEMYEQVEGFGVELKMADITGVNFSGDVKEVHTASTTYKAYTVIIATGAQARKLGFAGEDTYTGRGVAYCSTCDGEFYKDVPVFVIGGGFAAAEESVFLTRFASEVTVVMRKGDFSCAKSTANLAKNHPRVKIMPYTEVKEVSGDGLVTRIVLVNNQTGEETVIEKERLGVFVLAGTVPQTELFTEAVEVDKSGYIPVTEDMATNVPGVYAAGDILPKKLRQIVTAISDGAIAATEAQHYVADMREKLGLPEVSEAIVAKQAALQEQAKAEAAKPEAAPAAAKTGKWFNEKMAKQLQGIFTKLEKDIEIRLFLDPSHSKSQDMESFMREFAELGSRISVTTHKPDEAAAFGITRFPAAVLLTADYQSGGVRFSGIPSGHEVNSLVLAVYNLAGPGQALEEDVKARIKALPALHMDICVSLTCHFCPDVVAACHRIASLNEHIVADMIDASLFPELKDKYKLMSFPTLVVNEGAKTLFGAQTLTQILDALESVEA